MAQVVFFQPPPYQTAISDKDGIMTPAWQKWFQQLYVRNGGATAIPNASLSDGSLPLASLYVGATNTTLYASPTGLSTVIDKFQVTNVDSVQHTISIFLVPASSAPSTTNQVATGLPIPASSSVFISNVASSVIGSGGFIVAIADSAGCLKAALSGRQVS